MVLGLVWVRDRLDRRKKMKIHLIQVRAHLGRLRVRRFKLGFLDVESFWGGSIKV